MKLIGLAGKKQSGKTTTAKLLSDIYKAEYNARVHIVNFADALKSEVAYGTGHTIEFIDEHKDNFRLILQGWGTDYRRRLFSDNYWIDLLNKRIQYLREQDEDVNKPTVVIIGDVRFLNEVSYINSYNGDLIKVKRPVNPFLREDKHSSETELDQLDEDADFKAIVHNNGTIEELKQQLEHYVYTNWSKETI